MTRKSIVGILFCIVLLFPVIPYMASKSKFVVIGFEATILFSIFILILQNNLTCKFTNSQATALGLLFLLMILSVISNAYNVAFTSVTLEYVEVLEVIRIIYQLSLLVFFISVLDCINSDRIDYLLSRTILVTAIFCFFFGFISWLGIEPFLSISEFYGSAVTYSKGYAQFRSFAIIGQPGKQGIFVTILLFICIHQFFYSKYKIAYMTSALLLLPSLIVTFSRISIIFLIIYIIFLNLVLRNRYLTTFSLIVAVIAITTVSVFFSDEIIETFTRGIDLSHGKVSTLGHRMVLKLWAVDFLSNDWIRVLIGTGTPKEWIDKFVHPYAHDLTLRNPDSSQTVWFVRYGLVGMILNYFFYCFILFNSYKNTHLRQSLGFVSPIIFILIFWSFLDPPFHEYKIAPFVMLLSAMALKSKI
ncbi:O-antigen ligase family protein [Vibrio crassostreae]|uniref:O-antigen ligase family protein n=1 Tax=Vibrio crassostreae TaxID=246167 RepID=UPI001BD2A827|nr:O-antigen ligase family protein [Vibrio crassostreae]